MPNVFDFNPTSINPFPYWKWNKVLPAVYDDSLSQYEILSKLLNVVNNIIDSTNSTGEQVEQLTQLVQQLIDGEFPSGIVQYVTDITNAVIDDDIAALNATIESIQDTIKSGFVYNVMDYGATGDGTTDDTAAIQAAFNAVIRGGTVYFPSGRGQAYRVTGTINITTPFINVMFDSIHGVAWQTVGIRFEPAATNSILFNDAAEGVTFYNVLASSTVNHSGIFAYCRISAADTDVAFYNCQLVNFHIGFQTWNRGFRLTECSCAVMDIVAEIYHDSYVDTSGRNTQRGIVIENNRFHDNIRGIVIDDAVIVGMIISNNLLDLNYNVASLCNVLLECDDGCTLYGCSIINNVICDYYGDAIKIAAAVSCNISGNTFMSRQMAGTNGIVVSNVCQSCCINNNSIASTREDGIYVRQLRQSTISDNSIQYSASEAQAYNHGCIRIGTGYGFVVNGNSLCIIDSAAVNTNPIVLDAIGSYINSVIQNNTSINQSTIVHTATGATVTNCKFQTTITA